MTKARSHSWQDIQQRIRQNIKQGVWVPGQLIPGEVELAAQFGCARTTVNRALRDLAQTGVIDRKRKAGTRVAMQKARRVTAEIPVIRTQIESTGRQYRFDILKKKMVTPLLSVKNAMQLPDSSKALHVRSVHYAGVAPYIYEDRWLNIRTIPQVAKVDLEKTSVNEWLVENIPFTRGDFVVEAIEAGKTIARALGVAEGAAIIKSQRLTWIENQSVTLVNLYYAPGFKMRFEI